MIDPTSAWQALALAVVRLITLCNAATMPGSRLVAPSSIHNRLKRGRRCVADLKVIEKQPKERLTAATILVIALCQK